MTNDEVLSKAAKIKALAERGATEAEKANAEASLDKLLKKYGLDIELLDEVVEEPEYRDWHYYDKCERRLLWQIIHRTIDPNAPIYKTRHKRHKIGCYCTSVEALEIELEYEFYRRIFYQELDTFVEAFIHANGLYVYVDKSEIPDQTPEELERSLRAAGMVRNMDKHTRSLMIEDGSRDES